MLHPISAHFAIVMPLVALVLGVIYILKPNNLMSRLTTQFMMFTAIFMVVAFFTGKEDGSEVYPYLSEAGQKLLIQHKDLGLYLAIGMTIIAAIKMLACLKTMFKLEVLSIVLLVGLNAGVFYQGNMGGELTYTHGAHVKDHSDGMDCLEDPSDFVESKEEAEEDQDS